MAGCASQLVSCNLPPAMPYTLYCAILGDKNLITLDVNESWSTGQLQNHIKETQETPGPARTLTLYQVNIDISSDEAFEHAIRKVSQNTTYTQEIQDLSTEPKRVLTNPAFKLAKYFEFEKLHVPEESIRILVELPLGESIDSMDPRSGALLRQAPFPQPCPQPAKVS